MDFFIVCSTMIDILVEDVDLGFVKILRLLRTLRPLRFISHNRSMKLVVAALLQSAGGIMNVVIVILLTWMMFGILGISLQKNKMNYCSEGSYILYDECMQLGGDWMTYDLNFDNILNTMITLFIMSTLEGWPDYMYNFIDGSESGPVKDNQTWFMWYFVVFILVGSLFLLNLFIGVILVNYHIAEELSKHQFLT